MSERLDKLAEKYADSKIRGQEIYNENAQNLVDVHAADMAKKLGVGVFRGNIYTNCMNNQPEDEQHESTQGSTTAQKLAPYIVGAAIAGPLGILANLVMVNPGPAVPPAISATSAAPAGPASIEPAPIEPGAAGLGEIGVEID